MLLENQQRDLEFLLRFKELFTSDFSDLQRFSFVLDVLAIRTNLLVDLSSDPLLRQVSEILGIFIAVGTRLCLKTLKLGLLSCRSGRARPRSPPLCS